MVCLGNICRSPLAEGILKNKVNPDRVFVDSAGTAGYHIGNRPDPRSILIAKKNGVDITGQRCRRFVEQDFLDFDVIYVMDMNNYNDLVALSTSPDQISKIKLLLNAANLNIREVPDPYYGDEATFQQVFGLIDAACDAIADQLKQQI